jgi:Skp family chaperone for outer membrane proteins
MSKRTGGLMLVLAAMAIWLTSAGVNQAQNAAGGKAGTTTATVNLVEVFDNFEQTKVLNQKRLEDMRELDRIGAEKADTIKSEREALQAYAPDSTEWYEQNKKVKKMVYEFEVWKRIEQDRIADAYLHWYRKTYEMMIAEIKKVSEKRGIELVVTEEDVNLQEAQDVQALIQQIFLRKVVYSAPAIDITQEVLNNLNVQFQKAGGAESVKFSR